MYVQKNFNFMQKDIGINILKNPSPQYFTLYTKYYRNTLGSTCNVLGRIFVQNINLGIEFDRDRIRSLFNLLSFPSEWKT